MKVDLNVDLAEGFPYDEDLLQVATSANLCVGAHAGSYDLTVRTMARCQELGVRIGIHPGYPDREGMGRNPLPQDSREAERWLWSIQDQVMKFRSDCPAAYIKPHGAFYHQSSQSSRELAGITLQSVLSITRTPLMGMPGTAHSEIAWLSEVKFLREGFADRGYAPDGTLLPRSHPDAVLTDLEQIRAQVVRLAREVDTICIHGDTPNCVDIAWMVRVTLEKSGFEVRA